MNSAEHDKQRALVVASLLKVPPTIARTMPERDTRAAAAWSARILSAADHIGRGTR